MYMTIILDYVDIQKLIKIFVNTTAERRSVFGATVRSVTVYLNFLLVITTGRLKRVEPDIVEFDL